jgi:hypothetical protein
MPTRSRLQESNSSNVLWDPVVVVQDAINLTMDLATAYGAVASKTTGGTRIFFLLS